MTTYFRRQSDPPCIENPVGAPDESWLLDHSHQALGWMYADGRVGYMNETGMRWLGGTLRHLNQPLWTWPNLLATENLSDQLREQFSQLGQGEPLRMSLRMGDPRRASLCLACRLQAQMHPHLGLEVAVFEAWDETRHRQVEEKLLLAATVFEQAREGILITDALGQIVSANDAFARITGFDAAEVVGQHPTQIARAMGAPYLQRQILLALSRNDHWQGEVRGRRKNGSALVAWVSLTSRKDASGRTSHLIGIVNDITQSKEAEHRLHRQARYDPLTDLPNRHHLEEALQLQMDKAAREGGTLALLFIDLNQFRDINDNFGHRTGDAVLLEMAHRLRQDLRHADVLARLGGDEFAVSLPNADADGAYQVACKLQERMAQPCLMGNHELSMTAAMGIAVFPQDGSTVELLTRNAESAMYRAKQEGRGTCSLASAGTQPRSVRHLQLEAALRRAIDRKELLLHYQPQVDTDTRRVVGLEALVRWQHPELGMISPGEFIPMAEQSGQILAIGEWVMQTAAAQMKQWLDQGLPSVVIAVNLSAVQFRDAELVDRVAAVLEHTGLPPRLLELELTESVATGNPTAAIATMDRLHALGIRLSIDDFGTGYSSLNYLKRFRIDTLKIDQSFVRDIGSDPEDRAIVEAIIQMAHALRLTTIAEGVETEEQAAYLHQRGCDMLQGYHFCKPQDALAIEAWLKAHSA